MFILKTSGAQLVLRNDEDIDAVIKRMSKATKQPIDVIQNDKWIGDKYPRDHFIRTVQPKRAH